MLIYQNAEGVHGQRKFGNTCSKQIFKVFRFCHTAYSLLMYT